jgi:hypothetical protein
MHCIYYSSDKQMHVAASWTSDLLADNTCWKALSDFM